MKNILFVSTEAQKVLFEKEISGQISDGLWENASPTNHWVVWSQAEVQVTEDGSFGRNFKVKLANYDLCELIEYVGDRMIEDVKNATGITFSEDDLFNELTLLKTAMKTKI